MLNMMRAGEATDAPPLMMAHGLFGSARNWSGVAKRLSAGREVIAVDLRNHGESPRNADNGYAAMAGDLAQVIATVGGRADVLGHSMGGKAAMALALTEPGRVARLIVADIAPVAYGHSQLGHVRAMQRVDLATCARRSDADRQLADAVPDAALRAFLLQSLAIGPDGAAWRLNLDVLADQMPQIMGFPDLPGTYDGPTLFLSGTRSDYVNDAHWPLIRALFPAAERVVLPGVGHWLHAEAPGPFVEAVNGFLDR